MAKIEKEFRYNGDTYNLSDQINNIKLYTNNRDSVLLITDINDEILFQIIADCAQNTGFLEIVSINQ